MRFALLGPVQIWGPGGPLEVRGALRRTLLATLLLHADTVVSADRLAEYLWGDDQPASVAPSLHNQITRLRQAHFGDSGRIRAVPPGYLLHVEPGELDLQVFADHCAAGRRALASGTWSEAARGFTAALALWRGQPFADVPALADHPETRHLEESRRQALRGRIQAELNLGRHADVIGELRALTESLPLDEPFHEQLMLALYRAGRPAEALDAYAVLRRSVVEELGTEPAAALRDLHERMLAADPALGVLPPAPAATGSPAVPGSPADPASPAIPATTAPPPSTTASSARGHSAPPPPARRVPAGSGAFRRQLPADTRVFTGREGELDELLAVAATAPDGNAAGMVVISAVDGMAGIGKSALTIHAAHRVSDRFPDGNLFIDLRGHTGGLGPLPPEDALDYLLRSLDVPPTQIPESLAERAAFYRSRLAGTRTLIVLDNAGSTAQVRPLLPAEPGCLVLITSRSVLAGLDDAHLISLGVLPAADAIALLVKVAGPGRVPADHRAAAELVDLCGHVPLAVRIAGARLRHHRSLRAEDLVAQLRDDSSRLTHLRDEDRNLTALFDTSYEGLYETEQRLFRQLGSVPGPDVDVYAAANLADVGLRTAERMLESLLDRNLLLQHSPGRYRLHDLLRAYARSRGEEDPETERTAALQRLIGYYIRTAASADQQLARHRRLGYPAPGPESGATPVMSDRAAALAWSRAETANLWAAAGGGGSPDTVTLISTMAAFMHHEGMYAHAIELHQRAVELSMRFGDRYTEANSLWYLANIRKLLGDPTIAISEFEQAGKIYEELGDGHGQGRTLLETGTVRCIKGEVHEATADLERALSLFRAEDYPLGVADALLHLGRARFISADYTAAGRLLDEALDICRRQGDRLGEANVLFGQAALLRRTGDGPGALAAFGRILEFYRTQGNRVGEANTLWQIADIQRSAGQFGAALASCEQSLAIHRDYDNLQQTAATLLMITDLRNLRGEPRAARTACDEAQRIYEDIDDRHGTASAWHESAKLYHSDGDHRRALELLRRSRADFRDLGTRLDEARALEDAARCLAALGDREAAVADLAEAVALYQRIGAVEAGPAADHLHALRSSGPGPDRPD